MTEHETFTHDGKEFEIRTAQKGDRYCIKVFLNDIQVSPEYSVDLETHVDYFMLHQENLIDNLKLTAKSDIKNGMYFKE